VSEVEKPVDVKILLDLVPIKALSPDHCIELASKSDYFQVGKGTQFFKEGDQSSHVYYLVSGEAELTTSQGARRIIVGGTKASKLPIEQGKIHQSTAVARTDATYIRVDSNLLDIMLTWEQSGGGYEVQELEGENKPADDDDDDWMARILQAKVFHRIPPANIQSIFMKMQANHYCATEAVIKQGDEGEHFYIVREGSCDVIRKTRKNPKGVRLARLNVGDNFGEEALISGGRRNATVVMVTDGVLMSLSKQDFLELMNEPLLQSVNYNDAKQIASNGGVWIDVRLPAEYQTRHMPNSLNIPLPILRSRLDQLDAEIHYIVYCDTGRRSSTATYLLKQNGVNASLLQDGLQYIDPEDLDISEESA
jgi:CRP-like cAMP-binding protein